MARRVLDPHTKDRREPLEVLCMLAGRTNFPRIRGEGSVGVRTPLTPQDVAHAVSTSPEKLGKAAAMAKSCMRFDEWKRVHHFGYPLVLAQLQAQHRFPNVVAGEKKFRARRVLYDAFYDMVTTTPKRSWSEAADLAGIDRKAYQFIHKHITNVLTERANTAAADACRFLFAMFVPQSTPARRAREALVAALTLDDETAIDIDDILTLLLESEPRVRRPGILRLRPAFHRM